MSAATLAPTPTDRNALIIEYYPLVRSIAHHVVQRLPQCVDVEELVSAGVMGLIEAIDRFDPSRSVPFVTYARIRIRGSIVDSLRKVDWVPRSVRRNHNSIERVRSMLSQELNRAPLDSEIARKMEMSLDDFQSLAGSSRIHNLRSLDAPVGNDEHSSPLIDRVASDEDPMADWQEQERRSVVYNAVMNLPVKERTAVQLYYFQELSLKEIGSVLGVTESRACQLRAQGVKRLRIRVNQILTA